MIPTKSDREIAREIGARIRRYRLQKNLSAEAVATRSGLGAKTVLNAERGANPRLETVIKLLRALDRLDALDAFLPPPGVSPLALLERKGKPRRRASRPCRG